MDIKDTSPIMQLLRPTPALLPSYTAALRRGWSPDNLRAQTALDELAQIEADAQAFVDGRVDLEAKGPPITLPDGSQAPRLPGLHQWLWDGEFCGVIGLRWQPGGEALPDYCPGHIGYAVVPWKRQRGYATAALAAILPLAREQGLRYVELTTDPDNQASQRVIQANGGVLHERYVKPAAHGGKAALRWRITFG